MISICFNIFCINNKNKSNINFTKTEKTLNGKIEDSLLQTKLLTLVGKYIYLSERFNKHFSVVWFQIRLMLQVCNKANITGFIKRSRLITILLQSRIIIKAINKNMIENCFFFGNKLLPLSSYILGHSERRGCFGNTIFCRTQTQTNRLK